MGFLHHNMMEMKQPVQKIVIHTFIFGYKDSALYIQFDRYP
jgi:hypothetical protein